MNAASTVVNSQSIAASNAATIFNKLNVFGATNPLTNLNRNALGDIGNKIIASSNQQNSQLIGKGKPVANDLKMQPSAQANEIKEDTKIEMDYVAVISEDDEEMSTMEVTSNEIVDIDEFDAENPQLASEYVKDIYSYLIHLEV